MVSGSGAAVVSGAASVSLEDFSVSVEEADDVVLGVTVTKLVAPGMANAVVPIAIAAQTQPTATNFLVFLIFSSKSPRYIPVIYYNFVTILGFIITSTESLVNLWLKN